MNMFNEEALRPQQLAGLAQGVLQCSTEELEHLSWMDLHESNVLCRTLVETHIPDSWRQCMPMDRWTCVVQGMAILAQSGRVHKAGESLGRVLGETLPVRAEPRFWRLLEASGDDFDNCLRHIVRTLAEAGRVVDWMDIVRLCMLQNDAAVKADYCRVLAHDFCIAQYIRERAHYGAA